MHKINRGTWVGGGVVRGWGVVRGYDFSLALLVYVQDGVKKGMEP